MLIRFYKSATSTCGMWTLQNAGSWCTYERREHIVAMPFAQNRVTGTTTGIDLDGCRDALITIPRSSAAMTLFVLQSLSTT
jgi:hypothetical protein